MGQDEYRRPFPRVLRVEPAAACNLRCSHCPTGTVKMARGAMKPQTFDLVLQNIGSNLGSVEVVVLYHGGEPLLHSGFTSMVRRIKSLGVPFVKTVSNGMLLTEEAAADIVASGLDAIEFSLDGTSPEENNRVRRNGDYATVVRNVKRLIARKRREVVERPHIYVSTVQFISGNERDSDRADPEIPPHLLREFGGEYAGEIQGYKPTYAMRWPHMEVLEDVYDICPDPDDTDVHNVCDHVNSTITIRWNGDVVACCYDLTSRYVLGNIHNDSLAEIWNGKRYLGLRKSIDKTKFIPMCANCSVVKPNVYLSLRSATHPRHTKLPVRGIGPLVAATTG